MLVSKVSQVVFVSVLVSGCVTGPTVHHYNGHAAPPQVVYRIDEHRHFEIVPKLNYACVQASLAYVDTRRGIHSNIPGWDRMETNAKLVIDASNDQFLVAPVAGMDSSCAPDSHPAHCESFMVYSVDAGQTWKITKQLRYREHSGAVHLVGDTVFYAGHRARLPELASGDSAWTAFPLDGQNQLPPLGKSPIDTELHCDNSKTIHD